MPRHNGVGFVGVSFTILACLLKWSIAFIPLSLQSNIRDAETYFIIITHITALDGSSKRSEPSGTFSADRLSIAVAWVPLPA